MNQPKNFEEILENNTWALMGMLDEETTPIMKAHINVRKLGISLNKETKDRAIELMREEQFGGLKWLNQRAGKCGVAHTNFM